MKVGIVTEFYYPTMGGIQEHVHHLAHELQRRGHEVQIITSEIGELGAGTAVASVPVVRVGRSLPFIANGSIGRVTCASGLGDKLQAIFDRERFDVIHVHAPMTPVLPLLAIARSNTVTVGTFHANFTPTPMASLLTRLWRRHFERLDGVIAVSRTAAAAIARYFPADYAVIPNGVDLEAFHPATRPAPRHVPSGFSLLWVGRMEPRNGLDRMIDAFVLASAWRQDLSLVVVGDGPLRRVYEERVPVGLRRRVHFTGAVHAARPAIYAAADLLCVPVTISSFGITVLEGMAAGKPVIASDIAGIRDVMTHERQGLLVDTEDRGAFCDAILRIAGDRDFAASCGARGRATAEGYAWSRVADEVLTRYVEATARRSRFLEAAC